MINLLPDETKKQLRAAHSNVILIRYLVILGAAATFLVLAFAVSYYFIFNIKSANNTADNNSQSTTILYSSAKKQLTALQSSLSTAKNILNQQISYSDVITNIATILPSGIVINKLTLTNNLTGPIATFKALATSANGAAEIKENFTKSLLFSNYSETITNNQNDPSGFPVQVSISVTLNKGITL